MRVAALCAAAIRPCVHSATQFTQPPPRHYFSCRHSFTAALVLAYIAYTLLLLKKRTLASRISPLSSPHSDRVIVYSGKPGIECTANTPQGLQEGFNDFLKALDVTFRRDPVNFRPRVNKRNSTKDREQKVAGTYFIFDTTEDPSDKEDATNNAPKKGGKKK